ELPDVLVCQANDAGTVLRAGPFGPGNGAGLDLHAVHGWALWSPGSIESTASVKASQLPSFLVRYASAHGPALVDELGSYGTSEGVAAGYQRAAGAAAIAAGALGVLAWCWQDIASTAPPYDSRPAERAAGLVRLDGTARPALGALADTARLAALLAEFTPDPEPVAIYRPELAGTAGSSYLDPSAGTLAMYFASLLLHRAGFPHRVAAGDAGAARLLMVPAAGRLTLADHARLRDHLSHGGTVYLSVADHISGLPDPELTGVQPVDFALGPDERSRGRMRWTGDDTGGAADVQWLLDWTRLPARYARVEPTTARVLATFDDGSAACTSNDVGPGRFVVVTFPVELQLDRPGALEATGWDALYARIAALAGLPSVQKAAPTVEALPGTIAGQAAVVLINHGTTAAELPGPLPGGGDPLTVPAKGWLVATSAGVRAQAGGAR
ncbi:MAG: hypothetical protein ACRDNF_09025, partial [Streptosporangiaceae bacterium]